MLYKTHFNFGILCSSLFLMYIYRLETNLILFILIGGIFALIPDYDHNKSIITKLLSPTLCIILIAYTIYIYNTYILITSLIWFILAKKTKHRTFTHCIMGMLIFLIPFYNTIYFIPILIGYSSHLFSDMLTKQGCPLLYPFIKKKISILPITTGSKTEHIICFLLVAANLLLVIYYIGFINPLY